MSPAGLAARRLSFGRGPAPSSSRRAHAGGGTGPEPSSFRSRLPPAQPIGHPCTSRPALLFAKAAVSRALARPHLSCRGSLQLAHEWVEPIARPLQLDARARSAVLSGGALWRTTMWPKRIPPGTCVQSEWPPRGFPASRHRQKDCRRPGEPVRSHRQWASERLGEPGPRPVRRTRRPGGSLPHLLNLVAAEAALVRKGAAGRKGRHLAMVRRKPSEFRLKTPSNPPNPATDRWGPAASLAFRNKIGNTE